MHALSVSAGDIAIKYRYSAKGGDFFDSASTTNGYKFAGQQPFLGICCQNSLMQKFKTFFGQMAKLGCYKVVGLSKKMVRNPISYDI